MNKDKDKDINKIFKVIEYISSNFKNYMTLGEVADTINSTVSSLDQLFVDWIGRKFDVFYDYVTPDYIKQNLEDSLSSTISEKKPIKINYLTGLSVDIEPMTYDEYKNKGENLSINYTFIETPFGEVILATTTKGVCYMAFIDDKNESLSLLKSKFANANYFNESDDIQQNIISIFTKKEAVSHNLKLHIHGTDFQLNVWRSLLEIPITRLTTYSNISSKLNKPKAAQAVGTAIGDNPVALFIPCHRAVCSSGKLGGYRWGVNRKLAIIGWESSIHY